MIQDSLSSLRRNLLNFFSSSSAAAATAPSSSSSSSSPVRCNPNQNPLARKIKISIQNSAQNPESNPTKAPKPSKKPVTNLMSSTSLLRNKTQTPETKIHKTTPIQNVCQVLETRNRRSKAHKSTHTTWSRKSSANHPTNRARARGPPPPPAPASLSLSLLRFLSTPRFSFFPLTC